MKIIVLGGSGFVGTNLIEMIGDAHEVLNLSRSSNYDLMDYGPISLEFSRFSPDVIFNLASHGGSLNYVTAHAGDIIRDNVKMALNLYDIVNSLTDKPTIVNAISNCSYPGDTSIQKESEWLSGPVHDSVFSFANSRRVLYYISACYHKQYGTKSINLIFPNAFGINDHTDPKKTHALDGMIVRMLEAKRFGKPEFEVWGTGSPIREWIFSEDFCKVLLLAHSTHDLIIEPVNVAQGKGYSIKESVELIKKLSNYQGNIVFNTNYQDGDAIKVLDDAKFRSLFSGYEFVAHEEGLKRTIQYYEGVL